MDFDKQDLDFLESKEFKKFKKFSHRFKSSYNSKEVELPNAFLISYGIILTFLSVLYWTNLSPDEKVGSLIGEFIFGLLIFGYYLGAIYFGVYLLFETIIFWICKRFFIPKKYTTTDSPFEVSENRIKNEIISYSKGNHILILNELSNEKIGIERFVQLKNEYINNYAFVNTAYKSFGYINIVSEFLDKGKEIIETLVFHKPKNVHPIINFNSSGQEEISMSKILKVANEIYNDPNQNQQSIPLIDIIKKTLKEADQEYQEDLEVRQERVQTAAIEPPHQPLESKFKEILNKETKTSPPIIKPPLLRRAINKGLRKKELIHEQKQESNLIKSNKVSLQPRIHIINPSIVNWEEINNRKKSIGDIGELISFNYEVEKLIKNNLFELIPKIEHSSIIYGDGAGFDLKSFNEASETIYIEVKSTEGVLENPIYFSKNEIDTMKRLGNNYYLYRVHGLNIELKTGYISIYPGYRNIIESFDFVPETVKARLKKGKSHIYYKGE